VRRLHHSIYYSTGFSCNSNTRIEKLLTYPLTNRSPAYRRKRGFLNPKAKIK